MTGADASTQDIIQEYQAAGQGHVFRWWDELDEEERACLLAQLQEVDLAQLASLVADLKAAKLAPKPQGAPEQPEHIALPKTPEDFRKREEAAAEGVDLLRAGKVAALTVAGGQGTRLGFEGPKGTFPIGPLSQKTLFHIHAERLLAARRRYGSVIPWYIMTSDATDAPTRHYFEETGYFGLPPEDVLFFRQRMMPAVDREFRLAMVAKDRILLSPNGHGGTLLALEETGMLDDMERRGIEEISYFQIDNVLVPAVDPVFLGFHHAARAEMSSKAIWKRDAEEPIGAFVSVDDHLTLVEYSDLDENEKHRTASDGSLVYGLGSPAIHAIRVDFAREETEGGFRLPFHVAEKGAETLDESGNLVKPSEKNVYKFETFIFDALAHTQQSILLDALREEEFSPVKNAEGQDSPDTCRRDMTASYAQWLEAAGIPVPRDENGCPQAAIEISPLYALDAAELAEKVPKNLSVEGPLYLDSDSERRA